MIITTFSAAWFIMFSVQIALLVLMRFLGKRFPGRKQSLMLGFYIVIIVYYILYKGYLVLGSGTYETCFWNELPLALCQVASLMAYPGIARNSRVMMGLSFFVGTLCSFMGLLMPVDGFHDIPLLSMESIGYYGFHGLVFVQSICILMLGFYHPRVKDVPGILLLLALCAFAVHLINTLLRHTVYEKANYFFTYDTESNPVLEFFHNLIPVDFIYLLPMLIPLGLLILIAVFIIRTAGSGRNHDETGVQSCS